MLGLIKSLGVNRNELKAMYPEVTEWILLPYDSYKKVSAKTIKENLPDILLKIENSKHTKVLICDSSYAKSILKVSKVTNLEGEIFTIDNIEYAIGYHYSTFKFSDKNQEKNQLSINALLGNNSTKFTLKIDIHLTDINDYQNMFDRLNKYDVLACDIEGFGLKLLECGIATIGFAWNVSEGVCFTIDYEEHAPNIAKRKLLLDFFNNYQGQLLFHGMTFDIKHIVWNLYMNTMQDYVGMNIGLSVFKDSLCTRDMAYLCTNSADGNDLSLKSLALEYTGNYAVEVGDITKLDLSDLMTYNTIDCCATYWLYEKYTPILVDRHQTTNMKEFTENSIMLISTELVGMPMNITKVVALAEELVTIVNSSHDVFSRYKCIKEYELYAMRKEYDKWCNKVKTISRTFDEYCEWKPIIFNPNSTQAVSWILYEYFGLPILETTTTGLPSASTDTLEDLLNHTTDNDILEILNAILDFYKANKILDFVKAFLEYSILKEDGIYWLHGNQRQGGTISTRLSSNQPNLANLPSHGKWGKKIKECFEPPKDKLLVGSDYSSLEARIQALLSRDSNMLSVYLDGYDSHSLNTYAYAKGDEPWFKEIKLPKPNETYFRINDTEYVYGSDIDEESGKTYQQLYEEETNV